ncbi:ABC transporter substrate-binding protein [Limnochorda pilosa]|uniref:ABC transporter substrate-binding protein n=1 Tax=Limnochorda pilosa TaxID=1555112 RepID=A0A0K2SLK3_LIMPI|nr:ABC transporter substrate-binding protein [Limnochorda pilosa]BAS28006.1 ABC transporter substrate-binding protein [Limnochorda pilosa]
MVKLAPRLRVVLTAFVVALLLAGPATAQSDPIRIGVLLPYSGVYTSLGENITAGLELFLEETGYTAAGRRLELVKQDTQGDPRQGLPKVRQLVERDRVDLLVGVVHSGVAAAIRDYVHARRIPLVIANAGDPSLTRDPARRSPYIFRVSFANGQYEYLLGRYAYEVLGYRTVVVTAPDYSAGHDKAGAFKQYFEQAGGRVVQEVYPPLGTNDFGPYLAGLQQADAVWAFFAGTDAVRFVQQYQEFGLKERMPLIGAGDMVDEAYLDEIGEAALGTVTSLHYSPLVETPENRSFVEQYRGRYGETANQFAYQGYLAARVIAEAIEGVGGRVEETDAFLEALRAVTFTGPAGPFRFDPTSQNVVFNVYIRRVDRLPDGSLGNVVIGRYENVSDSW